MGGWRDKRAADRLRRHAIRPLAEVAGDPALRAAWARLTHEAADPNPFYGPDFLPSLLGECGNAREVLCALVDEPAADGSVRLAAFLPFVVGRSVPGLLPRRLSAATHSMIVDTTPLLDRADPNGAAADLVDALAAFDPRAVLRLPLLANGATREALLAAATKAGRAVTTVSYWSRAALIAEARPDVATADAYPHATGLGSKKRRELRRLERKLSERGVATYETLEGEAVRAGMEAFLAIEASGWKGRGGTALASRPGTMRFAHAALSPQAATPRIVVDLLRLDGVPIAAAVHLVAGARAGTFKCAYDERYARCSPGVLLDAYTAGLMLREPGFERLDSCAPPGHPVETLWTDTVGFSDLLVGVVPVARLERVAARLRRVDAAVRVTKERIKRLLGRRETVLRGKPAPAQSA